MHFEAKSKAVLSFSGYNFSQTFFAGIALFLLFYFIFVFNITTFMRESLEAYCKGLLHCQQNVGDSHIFLEVGPHNSSVDITTGKQITFLGYIMGY